MSGDSISDFDICENSTGILLLENAVHAPDVLDLQVKFDDENSDSENSEPDVVVLGVKRPTYEVITLEEEDEEETIEQQLFKSSYVQEELYSCPQCDKSFRVESFLKFHIRMHSEGPSLPNISPPDTSLLEYNSNCEEVNLADQLSNDNDDERFLEDDQAATPENEENSGATHHKSVKTYKHKSKRKKHRIDKCYKHKPGK